MRDIDGFTELSVEVKSDYIQIRLSQSDTPATVPNVVAYDLKTGEIAGIGTSPDVWKSESPDEWETMQSKVGFAPIFAVDTFNSQHAVTVLMGYFDIMQKQADWRPRPPLRGTIMFPGYERIPRRTRQQFEYLLQNNFKLKALSINGKASGWPEWQLNVARWSFRMFLYVFAIALGISAYFFVFKPVTELVSPDGRVPVFSWQGIVVLMVGLPLVVTAIYVAEFLAGVAWLVSISWVVSRDLLRTMLLDKTPRLSMRAVQRVAEVVVPDNITGG